MNHRILFVLPIAYALSGCAGDDHGSPAVGAGSRSEPASGDLADLADSTVIPPASLASAGDSATGTSIVAIQPASGAASSPIVLNSAPTSAQSTNAGDAYEDVGTNPFVVTAHDPFSTFAIDVDTASYDIFRRDIGFGTLPQPESVRLEEYINNFNYDYPAPAKEDAEPFAISLAAAGDVLGRGTALLRVGIQGRLPEEFEKKPTNLVFLIDTSGSMQTADKLPLVKEVLTLTLDFLDPQDTVSIVTYAGFTQVALAPTPVENKAEIAQVIESFSAGGSTAGASGLVLAYGEAEDGFIEEGLNHIVMCTDGDFNVGLSSDKEIVQLIREKRETGVTLTALGFGVGNLNDSMMEKVSNAGNGAYGVISSSEHAERYVSDRMLSTIGHIAKDVKIQVEFNPDHVQGYRLLGYENRAIADDLFRDDSIDAGEIGAGHTVTALYELALTNQELPEVEGAPEIEDGEPVDGEREIAEEDLVLLKVRYKEPNATAEDAAKEIQAALAPENIHQELATADDDLAWAAAMAAFAELLKHSPYADTDARSQIQEIVEAQRERDADRAEFAELFGKALPLLEKED